MKTLLTCNLSTKTARDGADAWAPPKYRFKEELTLALRFTQNIAGVEIEPQLNITGFRAAVGLIDARPASGKWALQVGDGAQTADNTTAALSYNASPEEVKAAIVAKTEIVAEFGAPKVTREDGSWFIVFGDGEEEAPLTVRENTLWPISYGRINAAVTNEVWRHEVRLIQMPVAFTDVGERVLPPAPSVTLIRNGGTEGSYTYNEIQSLYVPPEFRGTYQLKFGSAKTPELSSADNAETIQAALVAALGGANVKVTNPQLYTARIEFVNELAATDVALLTVEALDPPPGDFTFTIKFDQRELLEMLRRQEEVTLPFELRLLLEDDEEVVREEVAFFQEITIARPLVWPELASVPNVDWLRPPSPKSYQAFNPATVITGQQYFPAVVGNGVATTFPVDHGLDTEVVYVFGRENVAGGRQLVQGKPGATAEVADFTVVDTDDNSITVEALGDAPGENAWLIVVMSAQTVGAFAAGLEIEIDQVTGLQDLLDDLRADVDDLLELAPTNPLGSQSTGKTRVVISIPERAETFPGTNGAEGVAPKPLGGLLPAIHDAAATSIASALPDPTAAPGSLYVNDTGAALLLPGGGRTKGSTIKAGEFAASDGRRIYPVTRRGSTNSYFPRDFERELFFFEVNPEMLGLGTSMLLEFKLAVQLLEAATRAQWFLCVEHGTVTSETSPATTATNLKEIVWNDTPLLKQRLVLGPVEVLHSFALQVFRKADDTFTANKTIYNFTTAADAVPASAELAIRGFLRDFDTQDSVPVPRGAVSYRFTGGTATVA